MVRVLNKCGMKITITGMTITGDLNIVFFGYPFQFRHDVGNSGNRNHNILQALVGTDHFEGLSYVAAHAPNPLYRRMIIGNIDLEGPLFQTEFSDCFPILLNLFDPVTIYLYQEHGPTLLVG